ncbi:ABC transporter ATP-binding protein [Tardiphaga sp. vice352]|uniref:ABC transporter ATP-binding protein n=1 Tax=unclassified Tardiphaga TaxID=2631404 RepID=UPI0011631787|nr:MULTISPECIES: ABC transporter ATP-binding protein [unclassified Tardiphaga]QDM17103.1 ABC transporter ATP-binding protein [Tardiphaga sp. vice278]QDM22083.1 ABC transporter ATP-binding protein [Tardiphaga sp. vice154]QDM27337.1 ABC transporter ATP-binding protein [Tardiphaga sp. vice304]QDM32463.1 ABC transporter ATP-binding protein [Tardiphaga sp. vice352]
MQPLIAIDALTVAFRGVKVLDGVSLEVRRGEAIGLVGESGSGKSVTWLAALGLLPNTATVSGSVKLEGAELVGASPAALAKVRGGKVAMIFQDPASALNPVLSIRRQISETLALHGGLSGTAIHAEAKRLLDLVGIPDAERRLSAYPHEFSGGQSQRIMIAMALAGNPDLLIADEPTTALDATIQAQILELIWRVRRETGMAIVLISHDLGVVAENCDRVAVMYAGRIVEEAPAAELFDDPLHPYAAGLVGSLPTMDGPRRRLTAIAGTVPDPKAMPPGCAFAPRCGLAGAACRTTPPLRVIGDNRRIACVTDRYAAATIRFGQAAE